MVNFQTDLFPYAYLSSAADNISAGTDLYHKEINENGSLEEKFNLGLWVLHVISPQYAEEVAKQRLMDHFLKKQDLNDPGILNIFNNNLPISQKLTQIKTYAEDKKGEFYEKSLEFYEKRLKIGQTKSLHKKIDAILSKYESSNLNFAAYTSRFERSTKWVEIWKKRKSADVTMKELERLGKMYKSGNKEIESAIKQIQMNRCEQGFNLKELEKLINSIEEDCNQSDASKLIDLKGDFIDELKDINKELKAIEEEIKPLTESQEKLRGVDAYLLQCSNLKKRVDGLTKNFETLSAISDEDQELPGEEFHREFEEKLRIKESYEVLPDEKQELPTEEELRRNKTLQVDSDLELPEDRKT